ncbi:hypothetical protein WJX73_008110 [Symbiochloris irregularis]|uniref:F-box domain-containing protein n=1 Tax=Symbiochloris irregularis TaxID=706552 RepID=A0AAW1NU65_9CHLO
MCCKSWRHVLSTFQDRSLWSDVYIPLDTLAYAVSKSHPVMLDGLLPACRWLRRHSGGMSKLELKQSVV